MKTSRSPQSDTPTHQSPDPTPQWYPDPPLTWPHPTLIPQHTTHLTPTVIPQHRTHLTQPHSDFPAHHSPDPTPQWFPSTPPTWRHPTLTPQHWSHVTHPTLTPQHWTHLTSCCSHDLSLQVVQATFGCHHPAASTVGWRRHSWACWQLGVVLQTQKWGTKTT